MCLAPCLLMSGGRLCHSSGPSNPQDTCTRHLSPHGRARTPFRQVTSSTPTAPCNRRTSGPSARRTCRIGAGTRRLCKLPCLPRPLYDQSSGSGLLAAGLLRGTARLLRAVFLLPRRLDAAARRVVAPPPGLSVDVFVTTYNEASTCCVRPCGPPWHALSASHVRARRRPPADGAGAGGRSRVRVHDQAGQPHAKAGNWNNAYRRRRRLHRHLRRRPRAEARVSRAHARLLPRCPRRPRAGAAAVPQPRLRPAPRQLEAPGCTASRTPSSTS